MTQAIAVLRDGGIVALPTDTVYGIAVALATPGGIERLFRVKQRPPDKAMMLLLDDAAQAARIGRITPAAASPGRGLLAGRADGRRPAAAGRPVAGVLTGGAPTIGLRVPDHDAPRALARAVGPLPTTSANLSGLPEAADAAGIVGQLGEAIDLVLDGGPAHGGPASTVVDCTGDEPLILRDGASLLGARSGCAEVLASAGLALADRLIGARPQRRVGRGPGAADVRGKIAARACRRGTVRGGGARPGRKESRAMTISGARGLALESIAEVDPVLWEAMQGERRRQHDKIELIASENYVSAAVMEAQGSWLTNKYAEGLPGKRYYGGCEFVDVAERLAQERALALYPGAEHVNVQPHSGAQANMAAYFSVLQPGDRILGMNLAHGGHLTHGMALNFSGKLYEVHAYGVRQDTERIDYDALGDTGARGPAEAHRRRVPAPTRGSGTSSGWRRSPTPSGRSLFVDMAHIAGLVAAGVHPSPFPHADIVTTTTHKTLRGPRGGLIFARRRAARRHRPGRLPGPQGPARRGGRQDGLPGRPGRAADARHRGQGRRVQARRRGAVPRGPAADRRERGRCWPQTLADAGRPGRVRRHRQPPACSST